MIVLLAYVPKGSKNKAEHLTRTSNLLEFAEARAYQVDPQCRCYEPNRTCLVGLPPSGQDSGWTLTATGTPVTIRPGVVRQIFHLTLENGSDCLNCLDFVRIVASRSDGAVAVAKKTTKGEKKQYKCAPLTEVTWSIGC